MRRSVSEWSRGLLASIALAATACGTDPAGPRVRRVVGVIDDGGMSIDALVVPDTVRAGVAFSITVSTFGPSCLRADGAEVVAAGAIVEITPFDLAPVGPPPCEPDYQAFPRAVSVVFATAGPGTVRLRGGGFNESLILEEALTVIP